MKKENKSRPLTPDDYINDPRVINCIVRLKKAFGENFENLLISDTYDDDNNQYVNLVQKGGGVLGVSLVGYTYILEILKIRFLRLAGTSAGAINTALLTVIGKKQDSKSQTVLKYLCDLEFFKLVDGHPFACMIIKKFIKDNNFVQKLRNLIMAVIFSLVIFIMGDIIFLGLLKFYPWFYKAAKISFIFTGITVFIITATIFYIRYLFHRLRNNGYGINPGNYFLTWIKDRMQENNVSTVDDLNNKAATHPKLYVRNPATQDASTLKGTVTFIASELVTENKIEFPIMCDLFRKAPIDLHPAEFVRASMSIPLFFESYVIPNIPRDKVIEDAWKKHLHYEKEIPAVARFVDGGMLSNFPINIFYDPKITEPRLPTFGIDLDDSVKKNKGDVSVFQWSIGEYVGRMFNTIRYYYDRDFLIKNEVFKKGIGTIELSKYNWLNFFMSDIDKRDMFAEGAKAATEFILTFDWKEYQLKRIKMQGEINQRSV